MKCVVPKIHFSDKILFGLISILIPIGEIVAQTDPVIPKYACINKSTGSVVLRAACKSTETKFARSAYKTPIDSLKTNVLSLTNSLATTNSNLSSLASTVTVHASNMETLASGLSTASSNISTLTSGLSTTNANLSSLASTVDDHEDDIADLDAALTAANATISSLDDTLEELSEETNAVVFPAKVHYVPAGLFTIAEAVAQAVANGASEENTAVIKLLPGTHTISSRVTVSPGIQIQGSGSTSTFVVNESSTGALLLNDNTSLADLTITDEVALSPKTIEISSEDTTIRNVQIRTGADMEGYAIDADSSTVTIENSTILYLSGGDTVAALRFSDSDVSIYRSRLFGLGNATIAGILLQNYGTVDLVNSELVIAIPSTAGTGVFVEDEATLNIDGSNIDVGEGSIGTAVGVNVAGGSTEIRNSKVSCKANSPLDMGCVHADGAAASLKIVHSTVQANGGSNESVVSANSAVVTARFSELLGGYTLTATGGVLTCYGVLNPDYAATLRLDECFPD